MQKQPMEKEGDESKIGNCEMYIAIFELHLWAWMRLRFITNGGQGQQIVALINCHS